MASVWGAVAAVSVVVDKAFVNRCDLALLASTIANSVGFKSIRFRLEICCKEARDEAMLLTFDVTASRT